MNDPFRKHSHGIVEGRDRFRKKSIIDTNGNFALSASYDSIEPFANGTAIMSLNGARPLEKSPA